MVNGLLKLSWIEMKVFMREPLGFIGSLVMPVAVYVIFGLAVQADIEAEAAVDAPFNIAILAAMLIAFGEVQSLIAIIAIYRDGGILKRLRSTPLSPVAILGAHLLVKLALTAVTLALLVLAGRNFFPGGLPDDPLSFAVAAFISTLSILSLGFVLASIVPTARFAQPLSAAVLYPMLILSGLFFPLDHLPRAARIVANALPTTHAVALMQGLWDGAGWAAQWPSIAALALVFAVCISLSTRLFRWE